MPFSYPSDLRTGPGSISEPISSLFSSSSPTAEWGILVTRASISIPHDLLPATPLVTCLSGALDGHHPESHTGGWPMIYLDTRGRQKTAHPRDQYAAVAPWTG